MNTHRNAHVHDTRREQRKEATTRSGATAPTERHCADNARHTKKGSKTKSPFCVVLKTYHLTGKHHKTCLKHSNFPKQETVSNCYPTWNTMATARGQGTEGNNIRQNELRQGSKHGNLQHAPRPIGRDPELRPVHQISGFHFTHGISLILPWLQILERAQTRRLLH